MLLHNRLHKDQSPLWALTQGELWQRNAVPTKEASETGGAAAEEDDGSEDKR